MNAQALFDAIGLAPSLPGAACRGRHWLFDEAAKGEDPDVVVQRHSEAIGLCARCPALGRCTDWFESLPPNRRPLGVVAGMVNRPRPAGRPRRSA